MTYEEKSGIVISQLRADRDRLQDALDKIRAEIEHEREEAYKMLGPELGFDKIAAYNKCIGIIDKYKAEGSDKE